MKRRLLLLTSVVLGLLYVGAIALALPGEDHSDNFRLFRFFSTANPANGFSYGGISVGQVTNPGTKVTKHYACLVKNVAPPSLATSCTSEQVIINNGGGYTLMDPSTGVADNVGIACAPLFNAIKKGDACGVTLGTNATGGVSGAQSYSIQCGIPANGKFNLKVCTMGTITPTAQDDLVTVESYQ